MAFRQSPFGRQVVAMGDVDTPPLNKFKKSIPRRELIYRMSVAAWARRASVTRLRDWQNG